MSERMLVLLGLLKKGSQALGRSCGGFSTKIHIVVDALGNPIDFSLTGGETHESTEANKLLENKNAKNVLADRGYDSYEIVDTIEKIGSNVVIPPKRNRIKKRFYDKYLYKERYLIECCI